MGYEEFVEVHELDRVVLGESIHDDEVLVNFSEYVTEGTDTVYSVLYYETDRFGEHVYRIGYEDSLPEGVVVIERDLSYVFGASDVGMQRDRIMHLITVYEADN